VTYKKKTTYRLLPLSLLLILFAATAFADVTPTPEWISFWSHSTTLNGNPIPIGAIVDAYDEDNIHCGRYIVNKAAGAYGFMCVYQDDPSTSADDGATDGDLIEFRICGVTATVTSAYDPYWVIDSLRLTFEADLDADIEFDFTLNSPAGKDGFPNSTVYYTFTVENTGEGIDFFNTMVTNFGDWNVGIDQGSPTGYLNPGESAEIIVAVDIPADADVGDYQEFRLTVTSAMDSDHSETSGLIRTTAAASSADDYDPFVPGIFSLQQNYPNPFNPSTNIEFSLERAGNVTLEVYNVIGQRIRVLMDKYCATGTYTVEWDGRSENGQAVASGIYFYRLTSDEYSRTRKMMLMK